MKWLRWGLQLLIPMVVLYTIGYYIAGFSALTIPWLIILAVLIFLGEIIIEGLVVRGSINSFGKVILNFLVATFIIFTTTLVIEGGNVPLGGALLAAAIIGLLTGLIGWQQSKVG